MLPSKLLITGSLKSTCQLLYKRYNITMTPQKVVYKFRNGFITDSNSNQKKEMSIVNLSELHHILA